MSNEASIGAALMTITIGDKNYQVSRVRLSDLVALAQRIRDERVETVIRHRMKLAPETAAQVLAQVIARDPSQKERLEAMLSPEGSAFLFWRCIARNHKDVTEEQVIAWCDENPALTDRLLFESKLTAPPDPGRAPGADPTPDSPK